MGDRAILLAGAIYVTPPSPLKGLAFRNRYPTSTGGFSPRSSSELPLDDVAELVSVVADEDLYDPKLLAELIGLLAASIKRQT